MTILPKKVVHGHGRPPGQQAASAGPASVPAVDAAAAAAAASSVDGHQDERPAGQDQHQHQPQPGPGGPQQDPGGGGAGGAGGGGGSAGGVPVAPGAQPGEQGPPGGSQEGPGQQHQHVSQSNAELDVWAEFAKHQASQQSGVVTNGSAGPVAVGQTGGVPSSVDSLASPTYSAFGEDPSAGSGVGLGTKRRHPRDHHLGSLAQASGGKRLKGVVAGPNPAGVPVPAHSDAVDHSPPGSPSGYNSEDEYSHLGIMLTEEEWQEKDRRFERLMKTKGFVIKLMVEDGSCLFRAVSDQIYGDQEMHVALRNHCMDYISRNADYFSSYVTEDIHEYVQRKRYLGVHGNHLEIQALSEMYNRPIHIYCYSERPINIFQHGENQNDMERNNTYPIRLCYHRECHYNSLVDPNKATVGVGLGLPDFSPGAADRSLMREAFTASEQDLVEKAMLEDKIKATDWEATNEAIEEQVARESYLQWVRDNERRNMAGATNANPPPATVTSASSTPATVTSGALRSSLRTTPCSSPKASCSLGRASPKQLALTAASNNVNNNAMNSPKAGCSSDRDSPKPGSSHQRSPQRSYGYEYASFFSGQGSTLGPEDWTADADTDALARVLAASQQEYFDSLKKQQQQKDSDELKKK